MASSGSGWGKCRDTFAIELGSLVRPESKVLKLATTPYSSRNRFSIRMHRQPRNLKSVLKLHCFINLISWRTEIRLHAIHRLPKCKSVNCLCNRLIFIHVTLVIPTIAWLYRIVSNLQYLILILVLIIPNRKQPTVFDIDTGMRVWNHWLNTFCYNDMSTFSPDDRMWTP